MIAIPSKNSASSIMKLNSIGAELAAGIGENHNRGCVILCSDVLSNQAKE